MEKLPRHLLTLLLVVAAAAAIGWKYRDYLANPWTRDGMVRANVVEVTPRVSGPIVELPISDNQSVKAGDLLFRIDPRTFRAALDGARANLDRTRDHLRELEEQVRAAEAELEQSDSMIAQAEAAVESAEADAVRAAADYKRAVDLVEKGDISKRDFDMSRADNDMAAADLQRARSSLMQARAAKAEATASLAATRAELGATGEDNAELRSAKAAVETARLNLEFTEVRAPVDGLITNLDLRIGSQSVANQPALALIDTDSFWVHGYFRETMVGDISPGDNAVVTLMTYPDTPLEGRVDSVGWGIAQQDGSTGVDLLPAIEPTFEWIRLAQRVPVRIHLDPLPENVRLRVGTTASVLVRTGD